MITSYVPDSVSVIEELFGKCHHEIEYYNDFHGYCSKCKFFVPPSDLEKIDDLADGISNHGIGGGEYIARLVNFLTEFGTLSFVRTKGTKWYGLCYVIDDERIGENTVTYKSKTTQTFGFSICWLSEILFRYLKSVNYNETEIRRIINDN